MEFETISLTDGILSATAKGHPNTVIEEFHKLATICLQGSGRWRIYSVHGECPVSTDLDSSMMWTLKAGLK